MTKAEGNPNDEGGREIGQAKAWTTSSLGGQAKAWTTSSWGGQAKAWTTSSWGVALVILFMLAIKIAMAGVEELQKKVAAELTSPDTLRVGSQAMANLTRNHLFDLESSRPNKLGGERTHFWSGAAKSILLGPPLKGSMAFTINQVGLAQRWLGGTIRAGKGISSKTGLATRYLAIPARAESYGRTPGKFEDLEFRKTRRGGMLVEKISGPAKAGTTSSGGLVMYWLVPEVTQQADPSVMPSEEELTGAAAGAMGSYLSRRLA